MKPAPQVLRARELEPGGKCVDAGKILRGHISDQDVGHEPRISLDITAATALPPHTSAR